MELSILGNHWQISNKAVKNKGENKKRSNEFHEFIHYIADLIEPLFFIEQHISLIQKEVEYK